jgi:serine protease Do
MKLRMTLLAAFCLILAAWPAPGHAASANLELARQLNQAFIEVAERVSPAVVVITVVQKAAAASLDDGSSDLFDSLPREFWRYFHKQFEQQLPERVRGEGSGVIIRSDGYILTNGHVVEDAESIQVRLRDGRSFRAKLRGVDPQSDLAVIKIETARLPVAVLAAIVNAGSPAAGNSSASTSSTRASGGASEWIAAANASSAAAFPSASITTPVPSLSTKPTRS